MQRQNVTARWAKSRHTPRRSRSRARRPGGSRVLIAELDVGVHEVADRLHPAPAGGVSPNSDQATGHQSVGLAVAAGEQVDEGVVGQVGDGMLRGREGDGSGLPLSATTVSEAMRSWPGGARTRTHMLPKPSMYGVDRARRRDAQQVRRHQIRRARRMHVEHQHHRRRMGGLVGQVEADVDFHGSLLAVGTGIPISRSAIVGSGRWCKRRIRAHQDLVRAWAKRRSRRGRPPGGRALPRFEAGSPLSRRERCDT